MIANLILMVVLAGGADTVTYIAAKDIETQLAKPPAQLAHGDNYSVMTMRRTAPGSVEIHDKDTDVIYVVDGSATVVTGGNVVDRKTTAPGEARGSAITDGKTTVLQKGDVMTIVNGTPHWFSKIDGSITYFVVKVR